MNRARPPNTRLLRKENAMVWMRSCTLMASILGALPAVPTALAAPTTGVYEICGHVWRCAANAAAVRLS